MPASTPMTILVAPMIFLKEMSDNQSSKEEQVLQILKLHLPKQTILKTKTNFLIGNIVRLAPKSKNGPYSTIFLMYYAWL